MGLLPTKENVYVNYQKTVRRPGKFYFFSKRAIDIAGASIGLLICAPICLLAMILIKWDSQGRTLFSQKRVGYNRDVFGVYKFRTMSQINYEQSPTKKDDIRITRVGKYLRRYSIDEIPQFINVIKGEMSLVGPRPEMEFVVETYQSWQHQRFQAKPGITGLWQIMGRKDLPLSENIEFDVYYVNNRGLLLDLAIIIKTIPSVIKSRGAY